jgi:hypothetical protein
MTQIIKLEKWLRADNAFISENLQVEDISGRGRSVIATGRIPTGTKIMEIPRRKLLNVQTLAGDFPKSWSGLSSHQLLALYICTRQKSEKWSVFFECLPTWQELSTVPLTWPDDQVQDLKGPVSQYVQKQKFKFESDYKAICAVGSPCPDRQLFLWAWLCVNSRCIYMSLGLPKESNLTMAPYVDYLNHSDHGEETVKVDITAKSMTVVTTKDYEVGDEVYLSYGAHDNSFLLCEYGFILEENKWDSLDITEELTHLLTDHHKSVLKDLGYFGEYTVHSRGPSFRTEIALACLQEYRPIEVPRSLQALVDGFSDGQKYKVKSRAILRGILESIKRNIINRHHDIYIGYIYIINKNLNEL